MGTHYDVLRYFEYEHLPEKLQHVSGPFCELAYWLADYLPTGSEVTKALDRLLEAKDAAVRAALDLDFEPVQVSGPAEEG